jgi:arsenate reductase (thioredoxin)
VRYVLFVCNHNAGRSPMAQAFFELHAPPGVRAESAGSTPAREVWPNVIEAMREVGVDVAGRRPRELTAHKRTRQCLAAERCDSLATA